jgi:predicted hydrocarbon binding protein
MGKDSSPSVPFEFNADSGTINGKVLGTRMTALGAVGWASLQAELDSTFMTGGSVILQRMGYSYGLYLGRVAKQKALKSGKKLGPNGPFDVLLEASKDEGWGRMTLNTGDFTLGAVRLIVKDCFFCLFEKKGSTPKCHYLTGVIGGVADEITALNHRVIEGRCVAKGDNLCEIIIERVTAQSTGTSPSILI